MTRASSGKRPLRMRVGDQVDLVYDPADPTWIAVAGIPGQESVGLVVGVLLLLVGAMALALAALAPFVGA